MATQARPNLIDERVLKAQSHPIRAHILNILSEGPSSPAKMQRRMDDVSLNLVCHHVKVLREVGLIELVDVRHHGGRREHIYRATQRQYFTLEEWLAVDAEAPQPDHRPRSSVRSPRTRPGRSSKASSPSSPTAT